MQAGHATPTPETLSAVEMAQRMQVGAPSDRQAKMSKKLSPTELARQSLQSGRAIDMANGSATLEPRTDLDNSLSILDITKIEHYKYNPRVSRNPNYDAIKESIKALGITNPLTVTRRRGEDKYFPYGGGNTRLEIAKELFAEGDTRFAQLNVIIKAWTAESDVIAAHLAENHNRGDNTFWDNAGGVMKFKSEWEAEHKKPIAGSDLNQQLRQSGVNFGVRMVQNFVFAAEYLAPIGPWLRARSVNEAIRPALGAYLELSEKLGLKKQVADQLRTVLDSQALDLDALVKRKQNAGDESAVELDTDRLVQEATDAIAVVLNMPRVRMAMLAEALQSRPSMSAKDLQEMDPGEPASPQHEQGTATAPAARSSFGERRRPAQTPVQAPLAPMLGMVPGGQPAADQYRQYLDDNEQATGAPYPTADTHASLHDALMRVFEGIDAIVPINDFLLNISVMPFGYFIEISDSFSFEDDELSVLRQALWWFLVVCSGQTQQSVYMSVRDNETIRTTKFASALEQGPDFMFATLQKNINTPLALSSWNPGTDGVIFDVFPSSKALWLLLTHSQIGPLLLKLLQIQNRMRESSKISYPAGFLSLPNWQTIE